MKKFRKKLASITLSAGIAFSGVATCNFCTKCSALKPEEIAQLVNGNAELQQLIVTIRQQDFYKNFVAGKSKSLLIFEVQMQRYKLARLEAESARVEADMKRVIAEWARVLAESARAFAEWDRAIDLCRETNLYKNLINPLILFIPQQYKELLTNNLIDQLDFVIYLVDTDPSLN